MYMAKQLKKHFKTKIMKRVIILSMILLVGITTYSQRILLEETVHSDTIEDRWGKNLRHYGHFYFGFGFAASPAEKGAEVMYGHSMSYDIGYRYKFKICNYYALGADLSFSGYSYRLKQDTETKLLPDNIVHDRERFEAAGFKMEIYQRFNFGKRGNHIGNYLDLGAFGNLFVYTRHYTMDKNHESAPHVKRLEIFETGLEYMDNFEYGLSARVGTGMWSVFAKYRLSDLFLDTESLEHPTTTLEKYPELPALQIGIEIGLFD